jgi:hypothetical protein
MPPIDRLAARKRLNHRDVLQRVRVRQQRIAAEDYEVGLLARGDMEPLRSSSKYW